MRAVAVFSLSLSLSLVWACDGARCDPGPRQVVTRMEPEVTPPVGGTGSRFQSPLDAKDTAGAKQRLVEILLRSLNDEIRDPATEGAWDFWSDGSSSYVLPGGGAALLMSFRRTSPTSQEGFLVIGTISGQNTVVHGFWRVPAGIDDIHVMDMGAAGPMIYTVSFDTSGRHRKIFHHLLRFDGEKIQSVWSYALDYVVEQPKTYRPVEVSFRDEDGDGTREVRVRMPGADTPRLWKRRWATFKWDPAHNEFIPMRGLAFTPVGAHKPHWAAFGFLEALRVRSLQDARRFGSDTPGCRHIDDLWEVFTRRKYRPVGLPRRADEVPAQSFSLDPSKGIPQSLAQSASRSSAQGTSASPSQGTVVVDLERPDDPSRYQAHFVLRRAPPGEDGWRICIVRFFRT